MRMKKKLSDMAMIILACYPILGYYMSPLSGFSWGDLLLWLCFIVVLLRGGMRSFMYPQGYLLFWGYAAVITIVTASSFSLSFFLPGGFAFFAWSVFLGYMIVYQNITMLKKAMRVIVLVAAVIFVAQEVYFYTTGIRFSALLPISKYVYGGLTLQELQLFQSVTTRSCAFFMEPAYFAEYILVLLCLELFDEEDEKVLFNKYSILLVLILLFLRSGTGLVGLAVLALIKIIKYSSGGMKKTLLIFFFVIPLTIAFVNYYVSSQTGASMVARQSEFQGQDDASSGYVRMIKGYLIYHEMPGINKIIGISNEDLMNSSLGQQMGLQKNNLIANGIQLILIRYGILGLSLFLFMLFNLYNKNKMRSKAALLLFISISAIESTFLSPIMLIIMVISSKKNDRFELLMN